MNKTDDIARWCWLYLGIGRLPTMGHPKYRLVDTLLMNAAGVSGAEARGHIARHRRNRGVRRRAAAG